MYNPYLVPPGAPIASTPPPSPSYTSHGEPSKKEKKAPFLSGLSKYSLDSGDILLALILLFLALDGEDYEVMITLGLLLLWGLGED